MALLEICGFCGKTGREVAVLIAGPTNMICDECVGICLRIMADKYRESFHCVVVRRAERREMDEDGGGPSAQPQAGEAQP